MEEFHLACLCQMNGDSNNADTKMSFTETFPGERNKYQKAVERHDRLHFKA